MQTLVSSFFTIGSSLQDFEFSDNADKGKIDEFFNSSLWSNISTAIYIFLWGLAIIACVKIISKLFSELSDERQRGPQENDNTSIVKTNIVRLIIIIAVAGGFTLLINQLGNIFK